MKNSIHRAAILAFIAGVLLTAIVGFVAIYKVDYADNKPTVHVRNYNAIATEWTQVGYDLGQYVGYEQGRKEGFYQGVKEGALLQDGMWFSGIRKAVGKANTQREAAHYMAQFHDEMETYVRLQMSWYFDDSITHQYVKYP